MPRRGKAESKKRDGPGTGHGRSGAGPPRSGGTAERGEDERSVTVNNSVKLIRRGRAAATAGWSDLFGKASYSIDEA